MINYSFTHHEGTTMITNNYTRVQLRRKRKAMNVITIYKFE